MGVNSTIELESQKSVSIISDPYDSRGSMLLHLPLLTTWSFQWAGPIVTQTWPTNHLHFYTPQTGHW